MLEIFGLVVGKFVYIVIKIEDHNNSGIILFFFSFLGKESVSVMFGSIANRFFGYSVWAIPIEKVCCILPYGNRCILCTSNMAVYIQCCAKVSKPLTYFQTLSHFHR